MKRRNVRSRRKYGFTRRRIATRTRRFTRRVAGAVAKIAEKKNYLRTTGTYAAPIELNNSPPTYYNPIEGLQQGVSRGERIGNRIYLRKTKFSFVIFPWPDVSVARTAQNFGYRIVAGYYKNYSYVNTNIFEDPATPNDRWLMPVDSDKFYKIYDKTVISNNWWYNLETSIQPWKLVRKTIRWNKSIMFNDNATTGAALSKQPAIIVCPNFFSTIGAQQNSFVMVGSMLSTFTDI